MKMKKTIPALPVQDVKQSMDFYTSKLGFTVRHHDDGFVIVVRDDIEIHLWKSGDESWRNKGASLVANPICSGAESFLSGTASCRIEVQGIDGFGIYHQLSIFDQQQCRSTVSQIIRTVESPGR